MDFLVKIIKNLLNNFHRRINKILFHVKYSYMNREWKILIINYGIHTINLRVESLVQCNTIDSDTRVKFSFPL